MRLKACATVLRAYREFLIRHTKHPRRAAAFRSSPVAGEILEMRQLLAAAPTQPVISDPGSNPRELSWTGDATTDSYELWVNNLTTKQQAVIHVKDLSSTSFSLGRRVADGHYKAWVRAYNEHGNSPWSVPVNYVVGSFTAVPDTPLVEGPATATSGRPITLTWTATARARHYELWINNLTTGESAVVHEQALSNNSFTTPDALQPGRYRIWVRAGNVVGHSRWSVAHHLTVAAVSAPPARPVLLEYNGLGRIHWEPVPSADSYEVWADNLTTGERGIFRQTDLTEATFTPGRRPAPGQYRIWVRAHNPVGAGQWSIPVNVVFFSRATTRPTAPVITDVTQTDLDGNIRIQWEGGHVEGVADDADYFEIWVSDMSGGTRVLHATNRTGTTFATTDPLPTGQYRVWMRASNAHGRSGWSTKFDFSVARPAGLPGAPVIQSVTIDQNGLAYVRWSRIDEAVQYQVMLQKPDSDEVIFDVDDPRVTALTLIPARRVSSSSQYLARVRAVNLLGAGVWSDPFRFASERDYRSARPGV